MKRYEINDAGLELIISFEGFVSHAYKPLPTEPNWTIGFGHYGTDVHPGQTITRAAAEALLRRDVERICMAPMRSAIHVALNQNRVNALASLAYNCGPGALEGTIARRLNAKDYKGAADWFLEWDKPAVLRPRREQERALFLTPVRSAGPMPWLNVDERRWCAEYDRLKKANHNVDRRRVLREAMHKRAADIAYAAHHEGGWEKQHRRQRWHSLIARSS